MKTKNEDPCGHCGAQTEDFICSDCVERVRYILSEVKWLEENLLISLSRMDELGQEIGFTRGGDERPLIYSVRASEALRQLKKAIRTHSLLVPPRFGERASERLLEGNVPLAFWAMYLDHHLEHIASKSPGAPRLVQDLESVLEESLAAMDSPSVYVIGGWCPNCGSTLYAKRDVPAVVCSYCDSTDLIFVDSNKDALIELAKSYYFSLRETAELLQCAGYESNKDLLYRWATKGVKIGEARVYLPRNEDKKIRLGDALEITQMYYEESATAFTY